MQQQPITCPRCGSPASADVTYCGRCGARLQAGGDAIWPGVLAIAAGLAAFAATLLPWSGVGFSSLDVANTTRTGMEWGVGPASLAVGAGAVCVGVLAMSGLRFWHRLTLGFCGAGALLIALASAVVVLQSHQTIGGGPGELPAMTVQSGLVEIGLFVLAISGVVLILLDLSTGSLTRKN